MYDVEIVRLLTTISDLCVGEITRGYKVDADSIGRLIYEVTGLSNTQLHNLVEDLENGIYP